MMEIVSFDAELGCNALDGYLDVPDCSYILLRDVT